MAKYIPAIETWSKHKFVSWHLENESEPLLDMISLLVDVTFSPVSRTFVTIGIARQCEGE